MFLEDRSMLARTAGMFSLLGLAALAGHAVPYGLSDLTAKNGNADMVWTWLVVYHLVAVLPLWLAVFLTRKRRGDMLSVESAFTVVSDSLQRKFPYLLLIGLLGLILHWDAKLRLVDGHFDGCWASLRAAWLHQTTRESGLLRVESVLGHLLSSVCYLGVFLAAHALVAKGFARRPVLYFAGFTTIGFLYSLAIVSRSIILVLLGTVVIACMFGFISGTASLCSWAKRSGLVVGLFASLSFVIAMSLFGNTVTCTEEHQANLEAMKKFPSGHAALAAERAKAMRSQNTAIASYEDGFLDELPVQRDAAPNAIQRLTRQYCPLCNSVFIYLNHGIFNFGEVLASQRRGDQVLLRFAENWGRRLHILPGVSDASAERAYGRGGVTLPGAAFHDFGAWGVIAVALVHGTTVLLAIWLLGRRGGFFCLIGLALFVACGLSTAISGLFVAPALIGFPFVMFSILVWGGLALTMGRYQFARSRTGSRSVDPI